MKEANLKMLGVIVLREKQILDLKKLIENIQMTTLCTISLKQTIPSALVIMKLKHGIIT